MGYGNPPVKEVQVLHRRTPSTQSTVPGTTVRSTRVGVRVDGDTLLFESAVGTSDTVSIRGLDTVVVTSSIVRGRISDYILIARRRYD